MIPLNVHQVAAGRQDKFPLALNLCEHCYHLQLSHQVNPDRLFKNYIYVSGTSRTLLEDFKRFANKYGSENKRVLDIACNDGSQLDAYKALGYQTFGVDPALNLYSLSSKNHTVIPEYITPEAARRLGEPMGVILAQNVVAHTRYLDTFLESCKILMDDETKLCLQTSQAYMVKRNQFDTVYHEHLSFYSVLSMKSLVERNGLFLNQVHTSDVHGTSYVFVIGRTDHPDHTVQEALADEEEIRSVERMEEYVENCKQVYRDLLAALKEYKARGYTIVGYGAAAKANTLLNYIEAGELINFIVDDNPKKQNLLAPGTNIPVVSSDHLPKEETDMLLVPLAWNFADEIMERVRAKVPFPFKTLKYFPKFEIL